MRRHDRADLQARGGNRIPKLLLRAKTRDLNVIEEAILHFSEDRPPNDQHN